MYLGLVFKKERNIFHAVTVTEMYVLTFSISVNTGARTFTSAVFFFSERQATEIDTIYSIAGSGSRI